MESVKEEAHSMHISRNKSLQCTTSVRIRLVYGFPRRRDQNNRFKEQEIDLRKNETEGDLHYSLQERRQN